MPILESKYRAPLGFRNGHTQSIYPTLFRDVSDVQYRRERMETPDGDFLDLDWIKNSQIRLAIIAHGLEGSSESRYMKGMARALSAAGWDVAAWNFRGCSGELNRFPRGYHSGATEDLDSVISYALDQQGYQEIVLVGFSIGGNKVLKYLGERSPRSELKAAVAISVPCDLAAGAHKLSLPSNYIYMRRFLKFLGRNIRARAEQWPDTISTEGFEAIKTFREFDARYTAPLNGFSSAEDYWRRCSCKQFLETIETPTLLITAEDDPFLTPSCFPVTEAQANPNFHLELAKSGGHSGFVEFNKDGLYWTERRALEFFK